jgi:HEAT repeat protein/S1-C subfamily serine protease
MFQFSCPECDATLSTKENRAGDTVKCPRCAHRFTVPAARKRGAPPVEKESERRPRRPAEDRDEETERRPRRRDEDRDDTRERPRKKAKRAERKPMSMPRLAAMIGAGVAVFFVVAGVVWFVRSQMEGPPPNPPMSMASQSGTTMRGAYVPPPPSAPKDDSWPVKKPDQVQAQVTPPSQEAPLNEEPPQNNGGDMAAPGESGQTIYNHLLRSVVWIWAKLPQGAVMGTGSLVDRQNRLVLTNHHVVGHADDVIVFFPSYRNGGVVAERRPYMDQFQRGEGKRARVLATDVKRDLALLQIERIPDGVMALAFARNPAAPGQSVHSIGNPGTSGALWIYTSGTVRQAYNKHWQSVDGNQHEALVVETQSPVNPGDSGGPLVNARGELIGVTQGLLEGAQLVSLFVAGSEAIDFIDTSCRKASLVWNRANRLVLGGSTAGVVGMIRNLENPDSKVRSLAIQSLGNVGPEAKLAVAPLIKLLGTESDALTRRLVIEALEKIGTPDAGDVNLLITSLRADRPEVRSSAATALGKLGSSARAAAPALIQAVKDSDRSVRQNALLALGKVGTDSRETLMPVLAEALKDSDKDVRLAAGEAVAGIGVFGPADLPLLQETLKHQDAGVRAAAAKALGQMGRQANAAIPGLLEAAHSPDKSVRAASIEALSNMDVKPKDIVPVLSEALTMSDKTLSKSVLTALARLGPQAKDAVPGIALLVSDRDTELRAGAVGTIAKIGPEAKAAVPALIDALREEDRDFRIKVFEAIGAIGPEAKAAIPALIRVFEGRDRTVHHRCAEALGKIGKDAVKPLIAALGHEVNFVRIGAAIALGEIGPPAKSAVKLLKIRAQSDQDRQVRDVANAALLKINSKP